MSKRKAPEELQDSKKPKKAKSDLESLDKQWDDLKAQYDGEWEGEEEEVEDTGVSCIGWNKSPNCPACKGEGSAVYKGAWSVLKCPKGHFWWPSETEVLEFKLKDYDKHVICSKERYLGRHALNLIRATQLRKHSNHLKRQAKAELELLQTFKFD